MERGAILELSEIKQRYRQSFVLVFLLVLLARPLAPLVAEEPAIQELNTPRFILRLEKPEVPSSTVVGSSTSLASRAIAILDEAADDLGLMLHVMPLRKVTLHFLSPEIFSMKANAPSWATGVFYRGEILVPISEGAVDDRGLETTLRHEYVHAVIAEISNSRCPAWVDEGLAQVFERKSETQLRETLNQWLRHHELLPLHRLQTAFTSFDVDNARVAYLESFFAAKALLRDFGPKSLASFLRLLADGQDLAEAFESSYQISVEQFERSLVQEISAFR